MRKLALSAAFLALLGATAAPAFARQEAEHWIAVGMQGGAMGWDTSTIEVDEDSGATMISRLLYFATARQWDDHTYNFEGQDIAFKCKERQFTLASVLFMEEDGFVFDGGELEEDWQPVEDATPEGVLWAAVCQKAKILHTHEYGDLDAVLAAAKKLALPE